MEAAEREREKAGQVVLGLSGHGEVICKLQTGMRQTQVCPRHNIGNAAFLATTAFKT